MVKASLPGAETPARSVGCPPVIARDLTKQQRKILAGHELRRSGGILAQAADRSGEPRISGEIRNASGRPPRGERPGTQSRLGGSALRLRSVRLRAVAPLGHELIEFGLVLGEAQPIDEVAELALLVFEPPQGLGAVLVEGVVAA